MEVYGLTGGIGSGKSTVAELLEEYGIPVVSADELSRMVVAPGSRGLTDVVEAFGAEVLDDKGELDRKKMGRIVFTTPERRQQLEAILHPRIRERYEQVLDAIEKARHPVMVYEVPLLFEKKLEQQDEMKGVILVTATTDTRIARVKTRDTVTTDDVLARMRAQMPEQEKRQLADYIIHNDGDFDDLRREVEHLITRFLRVPARSHEQPFEAEADPALDVAELEVAELDIAELDVAELDVAELEETEIEESDIDTLSPEAILDEPPTARLHSGGRGAARDTGASQTSASVAGDVEHPGEVPVENREHRQVSGELEITMHSNPGPELQVELSAPTPIPVAPSAPPPSAPPSPSPIAPSPMPSAPVAAPQAAPAPAPAPVNVVAQMVPPSTAPRPPRPRNATAPQMVVPLVEKKSKPGDGDGEPTP